MAEAAKGVKAAGRDPIRWYWPAMPVLGVLVWLVLYPNLFIIGDSFLSDGSFTLDGYREFIATSSELRALWGSVWISLGSVFLAGLIGTPLAFIFARYEFPGRSIFAALASLPVLLPPLVGVIAFLFVYGESGILTTIVARVLGMDGAPWRLSGAWAILLVHAYTMYVYFFLFVSAGLSRLDDAAAEAALSLGASRWRVIRTVTLPMLTPSLLAASLLVFMTSMASFSAPYLFGGGYRVLTTQIFASKVNGELTMAMVETVVLAIASLLFLWLLRRFENKREFAAVGKGTTRPRVAVKGRAARVLVPLAGIVVVLMLLLPHLTLALWSFVPQGAWRTQLFPERLSLVNYAGLIGDGQVWAPILNSLRMASIATVANLVFCFLAAYLIVRKRRFIGQKLMALLLILPFALPGTVVAIALATTFSVNEPWAGRVVLVGSFWILPLAYFIRTMPMVSYAAMASFRQFDPSLEEASQSLGAPWRVTMRRVAAPLVLPGLAAGGLLAFVTALGEFVSSILLYTHRSRPISIEILSQLRAFDFGGAAALGVILVVLMAIVFGLGGKYVRGGLG